MGFWKEMANAVVAATEAAATIEQLKIEVRSLVNYKPERAKAAINRLVTTIRDRDMLAAVLDEFGEQLQAAETREFQADVNDLLWHFKETFIRYAHAGKPGH